MVHIVRWKWWKNYFQPVPMSYVHIFCWESTEANVLLKPDCSQVTIRICKAGSYENTQRCTLWGVIIVFHYDSQVKVTRLWRHKKGVPTGISVTKGSDARPSNKWLHKWSTFLQASSITIWRCWSLEILGNRIRGVACESKPSWPAQLSKSGHFKTIVDLNILPFIGNGGWQLLDIRNQ